MVVALFALAVAMIVGGLVAVVQGYDIVLIERGWTLVIAGAVCAASGALLLGIATAVGRLGRIQAELVRLREQAGRSEAALPPSPALDPTAALSSGLLAGGAAAAPAEPSHDGDDAQPTLPLFMRRDRDEDGEPAPEPQPLPPVPEGRDEPAETAARNDNEGPRLTLPRYLFGRRDSEREDEVGPPSLDRPEPVSDREPPSPSRDLEAEPVTVREPEERERDTGVSHGPVFPPVVADEPEPQEIPEPVFPPVLPPERDPVPEPQAPVSAGSESEPSEPSEPQESATVIGTYNSGDNRYVMFSDGSIEAETPDGVFRFSSLDELKEFIASGGESGARAAT